MSNSQNIKNKSQNISSVKQLLGSYLIAESIIEIREERKDSLENLAEKQLPHLNIKSESIQEIYHKFCHLVNYNYTLVYLVKIGLEDMFKYKFHESPSVAAGASFDTLHLNDKFGATFTILKEVNLLDHTLNVFRNAIQIGESKGRIMQIAIPILGSLFHDFGKSEHLREDVLGSGIKPGQYKAHAEVSGMYIRERLMNSYFDFTNEMPTETIDALYFCVVNHHPKDRKLQNDTSIELIQKADFKAREIEFKKCTIKRNKSKKK